MDNQSSNRYYNLLKNLLILVLGTVGSKAIHFLMLPLYTRVLSTSEFGIADIFQTSIYLIVPVLSLELAAAVFRFGIDKHKRDLKELISTALIFISFVSGCCLPMVPLLRKVSTIGPYIAYFYAGSILSIFMILLKEYVRGIGKVYVYTLSEFLFVASFAILIVIFIVLIKTGVIGYFISYLLALAISLIYLGLSANLVRTVSVKLFNIKVLTKMLRYSIPLVPNSLMWWILGSSNRYLVTHFLGIDSNGIFAVACRFTMILNIINYVFTRAWEISAAKEYRARDRSLFYGEVFSYYSALLFLLTGMILVGLPEILHLLIGPAFMEASDLVPYLLIGTIFYSFATFYGTSYIVSGKTRGAFYTTVVGAVTNLLLSFLLIRGYGITGAAISNMMAFLTLWIIRVQHTKTFWEFDLQRGKTIGSLILIGAQSLAYHIFTTSPLRIMVNSVLLCGIIALHKKEIKKFYVFTGEFLTQFRLASHQKKQIKIIELEEKD